MRLRQKPLPVLQRENWGKPFLYPIMATTHIINNNQELEITNKIHSIKKPFMNWWWCATIVGAIPCVVTNLLFKKNSIPVSRPKLEPVRSMFAHHTTVDLATGQIIAKPAHYIVQPTNYVGVPTPLGPVNLTGDVSQSNMRHYVKVDYRIKKNPYQDTVLRVMNWHLQQQEIKDAQPELTLKLKPDMIKAHTVTKTIHIPTVLLATRELTPLLEESFRHFTVKSDRRLSVTERMFAFGQMMLPKVISHLATNTKFLAPPGVIYYTASEIIYLFLKKSGRSLPHIHLINDYSLDEVEDLQRLTRRPRLWTDDIGRVWEVTSPILKERMSTLGECLFQFPGVELKANTGL